jgi:hypothetical protein
MDSGAISGIPSWKNYMKHPGRKGSFQRGRIFAPFRLVAVGLIELALLAYIACIPLLATGRSIERELFSIGTAAIVCLVLLARVLFRGTPVERFSAALLCVFPLVLIVIASALVLWR